MYIIYVKYHSIFITTRIYYYFILTQLGLGLLVVCNND